MRKLINAVLSLLVASIGVINFASLRNFIFYAGGLVAAVLIFNLRKRDFLAGLFLIGLFGTVAGLSSLPVKLFLVAGGALLLYFYQNRPQNILEDLITLSSAILLFTFTWSVNFFFLPRWPAVLVLTSIFGFLLFWQAFHKLGRRAAESLVLALISVLVLVEVAWALQFLPVYFLTAATAEFAFFYGIYSLASLDLREGLSRKKVYFQSGMALIILLVSLLSSAWQPL